MSEPVLNMDIFGISIDYFDDTVCLTFESRGLREVREIAKVLTRQLQTTGRITINFGKPLVIQEENNVHSGHMIAVIP